MHISRPPRGPPAFGAPKRGADDSCAKQNIGAQIFRFWSRVRRFTTSPTFEPSRLFAEHDAISNGMLSGAVLRVGAHTMRGTCGLADHEGRHTFDEDAHAGSRRRSFRLRSRSVHRSWIR